MNIGDEVVVSNQGSALRLQRVVKISPTGSVITLDDGTRWRDGGAKMEGSEDYRIKIKIPNDRDRFFAHWDMVRKALDDIGFATPRGTEKLKAALEALRE